MTFSSSPRTPLLLLLLLKLMMMPLIEVANAVDVRHHGNVGCPGPKRDGCHPSLLPLPGSRSPPAAVDGR